ncbi:hypothetical protein Tco_0933062 [Tanacetum coccineum]
MPLILHYMNICHHPLVVNLGDEQAVAVLQILSGIRVVLVWGFADSIPMQNTTTHICEPSKLVDRMSKANVPNDADYDVWLPLDSVHKVNDRMKNSLYVYFIGKRLAFPVVEWFVRNNWETYGLKKVTLVKGFFFFKFSSTKGVDLVLRDGAYTSDGLSLVATKIGTPMVLDSDNLFMVVPNLEGTGYIKEIIRVVCEWKPPRYSTYLIFVHSLDDCPKAPKRVVNKMDKSKGGSSRQMTKLLEGECVLVDDDDKPLKKVDCLGYQDSEDEIESVDNKMASYMASKPPVVGYGTKSLLEQWRETYVLIA